MQSRSTGQTTVAIDLGCHSVRVVEVEWSGPREAGRILRRGAAPLAGDPWSDTSASVERLSTAIRQAVAAAGVSPRNVVACLPRRVVTVRFAKLPPAPPEQMKEMVTFEAQQYILFSLDEVVLDYSILGETNLRPDAHDDDLGTVLLAAARRSVVADVLAAFDRAGVDVARLTVSALALAEHGADFQQPVALVDVEPGDMDVAVVSGGRVLYTRAGAVGTNLAGQEGAYQVASETARSLAAFETEYRRQAVATVALSGSAAADTNGALIRERLAEATGVPVELLASRWLPEGDLDALGYAAAVGAARQSRPGALAQINLVPKERSEQKTRLARTRRRQIATVVGILVVLVGGTALRNAMAQRADLERRTVDANKRYNTVAAVLADRQSSYDKTDAQSEDLNAGLDRSHPAVDVLVGVNRALPPATTLWLNQFNLDRKGTLILRGETKSLAGPTDFDERLQQCGLFLDTRLDYVRDAETNGQTDTVPATGGVAPLPGMGATPAAMSPATAARSQPRSAGRLRAVRHGGAVVRPASGAAAHPAAARAAHVTTSTITSTTARATPIVSKPLAANGLSHSVFQITCRLVTPVGAKPQKSSTTTNRGSHLGRTTSGG